MYKYIKISIQLYEENSKSDELIVSSWQNESFIWLIILSKNL